jgi:hypothetical protein
VIFLAVKWCGTCRKEMDVHFISYDNKTFICIKCAQKEALEEAKDESK